MSKVNICQSCGMPLIKESDIGTNEDGSQSEEYCRFCFQEGKFTNPNLTMEEQIEKGIVISKKMWIPEDKAREIANNTIPKLKRWQK
jgi:hypothetical protein